MSSRRPEINVCFFSKNTFSSYDFSDIYHAKYYTSFKDIFFKSVTIDDNVVVVVIYHVTIVAIGHGLLKKFWP